MPRERQTFTFPAVIKRDDLIAALIDLPRTDLRAVLREIDTRVADLDFTIEHRDWLNDAIRKEDASLALIAPEAAP